MFSFIKSIFDKLNISFNTKKHSQKVIVKNPTKSKIFQVRVGRDINLRVARIEKGVTGDKTILPRVNVGLKLRKFGEKNITKVSIHNLSGLPIWIWLDIELFLDKDFKKEKRLPGRLSYKGFPISPNQAYEFPYEKVDLIIKKHSMIYARIKYRCNINSYLPEPDIKSTELIYRYDANRKIWLIDGVGMEFMPLYELRKT